MLIIPRLRSGRIGAAAIRRLALAGAVVTAIVLALAVTTRPVAALAAHAELASSVPAAGEDVDTAPAQLVLHFTEGVDVADSSVAVTVGGVRVATGPLRLQDETTVIVPLLGARPSGTYDVEWRSVSSDDGHVATGHYEFSAASGGAAVPAAIPTSPQAHTTGSSTATGAGVASAGATRIATDLFQAVRAVGYLAIAVIVGGLMFLVFVWPDAAGLARTRVVLGLAWAAGFVTSLLGFGLQSALTHQRGVGGMLDTTRLGQTLGTHAGQAWAARGLLFLLILPVLAVLAAAGDAAPRTRWWQVGAGVVGLGLVRAPGLSGHSIEGVHGVAGSAADLVHLAAMSMWVGGLVLMAFVVLPEAYPSELAWIVPRFSKIAAGSVVLLVAAGAVLGWDVAGGLHGLLHTHYGRVLGIKILLLTAALVAARSSKRWTDSRLRLALVLRGDRVTVRPFAISVAAEALLAVAVLGVASILVSSSPGI